MEVRRRRRSLGNESASDEVDLGSIWSSLKDQFAQILSFEGQPENLPSLFDFGTISSPPHWCYLKRRFKPSVGSLVLDGRLNLAEIDVTRHRVQEPTGLSSISRGATWIEKEYCLPAWSSTFRRQTQTSPDVHHRLWYMLRRTDSA